MEARRLPFRRTLITVLSLTRRRSVLVVSAWLLLSESTAGAELQERTARAYQSSREGAQTRFLARPRKPGGPSAGGVIGRPAAEDGIISIAGGLVHHWTGAVFIPNVTLKTSLDVSRNYAAYPSIYKEIVRSRVLERDGDKYWILLRLKEGEAGITAVLDVRSRVRYEFPDASHAVAVSESDEIREVRRPGATDEVLLPPGRDSGYLWRTDVFTAFVQTAEGVYIEMETLGLSRPFPPMLGWIIEPIARRFGLRSVVQSLEQFRAAAIAAARAQ
jgi:hypothetical protein